MPGDFLVTLYTGSRWGAGTKADVFLQLIGQNGTSDVHCLRHPQVSSFHQGSTDRFLLTTREELGDICTFRVWHRNLFPTSWLCKQPCGHWLHKHSSGIQAAITATYRDRREPVGEEPSEEAQY
uniref:PLAT domain-containing protein n=1 Tax=Anas platyrhynchos platyrhynchos TaxID=8840 RepID=A0A493U3R2_ANAPP